MSEKLLNTREVAEYLGISEEELRKLVDSGKIPAYRLGGAILRFKKEQIDAIKTQGTPRLTPADEEMLASQVESSAEKLKDFLYFNDFYLISAIIIIVLLVVIFLY